MRVLILGGTGEARALAAALADRGGIEFQSSLAGRVSNPALPAGSVRIGGFGGASGLADHLREGGFDAVVDATHPFAATITAHAVTACAELPLPLLCVRRTGWSAGPGDDWRRVPTVAAAAALVASMAGQVVLLTTGRRDLAAFSSDHRHHYVVRTVDPPDPPLPPRTTLLLSRGPYSVAGERALLAEHGVDVLVTKDSGGEMTSAKLVAARERGIPAVVVDRPPLPAGVAAVDSVEDVLSWLDSAHLYPATRPVRP